MSQRTLIASNEVLMSLEENEEDRHRRAPIERRLPVCDPSPEASCRVRRNPRRDSLRGSPGEFLIAALSRTRTTLPHGSFLSSTRTYTRWISRGWSRRCGGLRGGATTPRVADEPREVRRRRRRARRGRWRRERPGTLTAKPS